MKKLLEEDLISDFSNIGISHGDTILVRASLGAVGRMEKKAETFINALLKTIGTDGTLISLAFTSGSFFRKPKKDDAFHLGKRSYAGALPNAMLNRDDSFRSKHPMCSFVAIGKNAEEIISGHNESSSSYEPVRKVLDLDGKCILVGCVGSSPGFTTTHLAEYDLGHSTKLPVFPWLYSTYYIDDSGKHKIFRRDDLGLCSNSFNKFYSIYVQNEIIKANYIGNAYSVLVPAQKAYELENIELSKNKKFNVCKSKLCFMCNGGRWDRAYLLPLFVCRRLMKKYLYS